MAFVCPIPSQLEGVAYVNTISKILPHKLHIRDHSKVGNIAAYSAMTVLVLEIKL
ncbi:hypothetical protein TEGL_25010 [Terrisporobacter glycolicus ATCC 14880 = DSM 1288]|uniref:Uncharacterized protein n=1 Tax=Terrisporobacter glycolicus ATCC 14880 = DSM 1288 TaxID=1121315 RepID=A0ABZ2EX81_9FIRM|nr:Mbeg1-like protein [Terrisporobacter glycolicus]